MAGYLSENQGGRIHSSQLLCQLGTSRRKAGSLFSRRHLCFGTILRGSKQSWDISVGRETTFHSYMDLANAAGMQRPGPYINAEVSGGGFPGEGDIGDSPLE